MLPLPIPTGAVVPGSNFAKLVSSRVIRKSSCSVKRLAPLEHNAIHFHRLMTVDDVVG